jgi:hypothetical protein
VARHRAYHALRTERRRQRRLADDRADALLDTATDGRPGALATLLADEDRRLLVAVLDELPDDTREVVTLFYREGRSTAQVAALLGLSDAAVRKRLSRARAVLRASLLDRFGDAARKSAPGVTFTAAVASALTVGAPASASAAAATGATSLAAGSSILMKVVPFALTVAMSAAGGMAGVLLGTRSLKRQARFPDELVGLRRFQAASIGAVWAAAVLFPASWFVTGSPWSQVVTFVAFLAALGGLHGFWLPAIVAARHAIEMAEDPARARAARARERRLARLGWTAGILSGSAGLLAGLWSVL